MNETNEHNPDAAPLVEEYEGPFRIVGDNPPRIVDRRGNSVAGMMWPVHAQTPEGEAAAVQHVSEIANVICKALNAPAEKDRKWHSVKTPCHNCEACIEIQYLGESDQSARIAELERELLIERGENEAGDRVLKDQDEEIAELKRRVEENNAELENLRAFVGKEIIRADFQTVGDMRKRIESLRAEVERLTTAAEIANDALKMVEMERDRLADQLAEREEDRARFLGVQRFWHLIHHSGPDMSGKHWVAKLEHYERATERVRFLTLGEAVDALAAVEAESLAAIRAARAQEDGK